MGRRTHPFVGSEDSADSKRRSTGVATVFGGDPFQRFMVERKLSMQQRRGALGVSRGGGGEPIFLRNADLLIGGEVTENRIDVN